MQHSQIRVVSRKMNNAILMHSGYLPMMARAVALVSLPLAPSSTSSPEPSSLQRLMVLFPELIQ